MSPSAYGVFRRAVESAAGHWFRKHDFPVQSRRPYILTERRHWPDNILLPEVAELASGIRPLHKWIHHGLSSQAMAFNLFGPLVVRDDLQALRATLEAAGINWPTAKISGAFEVEDREVFNELQAQPTSIDFVIGQVGSSDSIYIEAKFVEQEFGGCSVFERGDCDGSNPVAEHNRCYLHAIGRRYWTVMNDHGISNGEIGSGPFCAFTSHYQFFREVGFALHQGGQMVFLYDERNPAFKTTNGRGLIPFLCSLLPQNVGDRVKSVTIQALAAGISATQRHDDWIGEFRLKYGLD